MSTLLPALGYYFRTGIGAEAAIRLHERITLAAEAAGYRLMTTFPDEEPGDSFAYLLAALAFDTSVAAIVVSSVEDLSRIEEPREVLCAYVSVVFLDSGERWDRRPSLDGTDDLGRAEVLTTLAELVLKNNAPAADAEAAA